jgi:DNA-binding PadR family transcriptional regulator
MAAVLKLRSINGRPILRGYEHVWSVILELTRDGASFTKHDVDQASCDPDGGSTRDYLRRLRDAGVIEEVGEEPIANGHRRKTYRLVERRAEAPRLRRDGSEAPPSVQQLLWNTMRNLLRDGFTSRELAAFASTDDRSIPTASANSYVKHLAAAGYLLKLVPGRPNHLTKWRLRPSMNTGPKPPKILRTHAIYDPNTCSLHGDGIAEEVAS